MRTVFIFHGTGGNPQGNWFPWLKEKLEKKGLKVIVPKFPTPEGQSLPAWFKVFDAYKENINEKTIFIGHSLGGVFLLKVLEQLKHPVYAAFFVATPVGVRPIKFYDSDYSFAQFNFDWPVIVHKAKHVIAYHSDNDPYVYLANGEELAKRLGITLTFIPNAGHINATSGWTKFDKLLEDIEQLL